jgi:hypothetical protein
VSGVMTELPVFTLTRNEATFCESVGHLRYTANLGRPNSYGLKRDGRDEEVLGAYGEYCVSLWLDRSWRAVVDNPWSDIEGDVGRFQIRTTANSNDPHLICHPRDKDDATFILVSRQSWDTYRIEGWTYGSVAKDDKWWGDKYRNGRPAFFLPANELYDPSDFDFPVRP